MYKHKEIEKKWQRSWKENHIFRSENISGSPKFYALDMFPYPSGAGLHVGHPEGYTANDIVARYKHANGYNVLHPMGWDAFGLPAENYAIKTGTHPKITTAENIAVFKKQIKSLGFSYDWEREIDTTDPKYFKWTQWIFLKMFEHGLAYEQDLPINYCPSCKTGLANEEVVLGRCDRCDNLVEKRKIRQWVLAITKYADRLANDVEKLDWPKGIKDMQKNWIGRSEGCEFKMEKYNDKKITVLVLHGWGGNSEGGWKPWLKKELEVRGYNVIIPDLPETNTPDLYKQLSFLEQYTPELDEDSIIIGHSWGAFLANHLIMKLNHKVSQLIHIGGAYDINVLADQCKSWEGYETIYKSMSNAFDMNIVKEKTSTVISYISKTDPYIDFKSAKEFYEKHGIALRIFEDKGHFNEDANIYEIPELLEDICRKTPSISVYTTRIDTVFGMTYAVIAPDYKDVEKFITSNQKEKCEKYILEAKNKADLERTGDNKEKTGVFTGSFVINPYNNQKVPLWIADYVLGNYGTGAVMAVPAHDERDYEFARKYNFIFKTVVTTSDSGARYGTQVQISKNSIGEINEEFIKDARSNNIIQRHQGDNNYFSLNDEPYEIERLISFFNNKNIELENYTKWIYQEDGILINSGKFDGLSSAEARIKLTQFAEEKGFGEKKVNYKLRDWLFSRQRYWGEPIPLIHLDLEDLKKLPHIDDISKASDENLAYILKRKANQGENCERVSCGCGHIRELVIKKKVFSKIYDGIYEKIVCDYDLPLKLPEVEHYEPLGDGQSPLASVEYFVNVTLAKNLKGRRETNTMPQWGGSCWYYLRYMDPHNENELVNKEIEKYWGSVDSYVGGAEHAVLHLLYARFWHKFLFDIGVVSSDEPFQRLRNQGMILGLSYKDQAGKLIANDLVKEKEGKFYHIETGEELSQMPAKMSKSLKNVINPDEVIEEYGADTLRLYEMYMGDFKDTKPWDTKAIVGVRRFLDKLYRIFEGNGQQAQDDVEATKLLHKTIKKVGEDIADYRFNTSIAQMMILTNYGLPKDEKLATEWKEVFAKILHPFAPHIAEEFWEMLGNTESIFFASWPQYDANLVLDNTVKIGVQINGKVRGEIEIGVDESKESVLEKARNQEEVVKWLNDKEIIKEIYIPGKILNIVVK